MVSTVVITIFVIFAKNAFITVAIKGFIQAGAMVLSFYAIIHMYRQLDPEVKQKFVAKDENEEVEFIVEK